MSAWAPKEPDAPQAQKAPKGKFLSTLHPNTILTPNLDPNAHPNPKPSPTPTPDPSPSSSPNPSSSSRARLGSELVLGSKMESNDVAKSCNDLVQPKFRVMVWLEGRQGEVRGARN